MSTPADLRARAEALGSTLPALLAEAQHLAATLASGAHGRKQAGQGDAFWQYLPAEAGDGAQMIDWRRSARSDSHFVRQREWQAVQTVQLWVDGAQTMDYASARSLPPKKDRAQVLALALAVLLLRGGERVGVMGGAPARAGRGQITTLMADMARTGKGQDYGAARPISSQGAGRCFYISDFLGPLAPLKAAMTEAAAQGLRGCLLQVLDPAEEDFPFAGRVIFESMGGSLQHETQSAADLRGAYLARLAERKDALARLCHDLGWLYTLHHTDRPATQPLIWAYGALGVGGGA